VGLANRSGHATTRVVDSPAWRHESRGAQTPGPLKQSCLPLGTGIRALNATAPTHILLRSTFSHPCLISLVTSRRNPFVFLPGRTSDNAIATRSVSYAALQTISATLAIEYGGVDAGIAAVRPRPTEALAKSSRTTQAVDQADSPDRAQLAEACGSNVLFRRCSGCS
jgi:hypothetical protein